MRIAVVAALVMGGTQETPVVWVFFSPDSPDASGILRQLKGRPIRTVLLTERYFGKRRPSRNFLETLRVAGEVRVVDPEGLREAERLGITRLPAVAVTRSGRSHVAFGNRVNVEELLRCSR